MTLLAELWLQNYSPLENAWLSTLAAAAPIVVMLAALAFLRLPAHWAALLGLTTSLEVAVLAFHMPLEKAAASALLGAAYGLLPIGWIILNVIFLYNLVEGRGLLEPLKHSLTRLTRDARLQLLLIAFCFGAFFEGAAGFGTPVAVSAAILIGLGFSPLQASGLSLIANTAPVAFGALGTPILALKGVTGFDERVLSAMVGRQLPFFSLIVPFWMICAYSGLRGALQVWPALLVGGISFAIPQFLISNLHGPWLVDIVASVCSMVTVTLLLRVWSPRHVCSLGANQNTRPAPAEGTDSPDAPNVDPVILECAAPPGGSTRPWMPWMLLTVFVFVWGLPPIKAALDEVFSIRVNVPTLHLQIARVPPVVAAPIPEPATFNFNILSTTGTGILLAGGIAGLLMGYSLPELARAYVQTLRRLRFSLVTVAAMLALGYVTRYAGLDAALGLACARTGRLYPIFGTLLGWLGVALTGSDTASNVLFGSLQKITAVQLGLSPVLMAAANSSGGVMGKMIDAQSIVVASTATRWFGQEGRILRYVFLHSLTLALLVGLLVLLQAYVWPFTLMHAN